MGACFSDSSVCFGGVCLLGLDCIQGAEEGISGGRRWHGLTGRGGMDPWDMVWCFFSCFGCYFCVLAGGGKGRGQGNEIHTEKYVSGVPAAECVRVVRCVFCVLCV